METKTATKTPSTSPNTTPGIPSVEAKKVEDKEITEKLKTVKLTKEKEEIVKKVAKIMRNASRTNFTTVPDNMRDDTSLKIGSEFKPGSRDIIRGLDPIQEKVILPSILGVPHTSHDFIKLAKEFWVEFKVSPPPEPNGKRLDYTTMKSEVELDGKIVTYTEPLNPYEYMTYRFCKQSSKVAKTPQEIQNRDMYDFILVDEGEAKKKEMDLYKLGEEADIAFSTMVSETSETSEESIMKLDFLIQVLKSSGEYMNLQEMTLGEKKQWLRNYKNVNPSAFVNTARDKNLRYKGLRVSFLQRNLIRLEGDFYYLYDENLGKEAGFISWMKDPKNSEKVRGLMVQLEEKLKQERGALELD